MNQAERDALRANHGTLTATSTWCVGCSTDEGLVIHPCDVIRVLDALEAVVHDATEPTATECDHVEGGEITHSTEGINVWLRFTYCPRCGEKL